MKVSQYGAGHLLQYSGLELRHLRLIWTLAEERSLTRAAARLRLTPSALSHQLRALEEIAGGSVVRRDRKVMRLTGAGEMLLGTATRVLTAVREAEDGLSRIRLGTAGVVRISTHCYTGYHWLPGVMRSFQADFPDVDVRIVAEATTRPVEALRAGEIDVAIAPEVPIDQCFKVRAVLRDEMVLVMAPEHRLTARSWVKPEEIAREHLLAYATRPERSPLCLEILQPAGLIPAKATSVRLTEAIVEMVRSGIGVAAMAEWAVRPYVANGAVATRRITRRGWRRTWHAITRQDREAGTQVVAFVDRMVTEFGAKRKLTQLRY
jgi:LysR family transcriptional regulator for metE and metH